ncbi:MAG: HIT family protein [Eubacterium sp.]
MCDICNTIKKSLRGENPFFVKELDTGIVVLGWNQHFYGYTIFMCKRHATELYQLDKDFRARFMEEMVVVSEAVAAVFDCDKMNYECLGNGDTHLHWHLFPRVKGDLGDYGNDGKGPVWWLPQEIMWNEDNIPNEQELEIMKAKLLKELEK